MHGREGEARKLRRWHMWPVSSPSTAAAHLSPASLDSSSLPDSVQSASASFLKDGREIRVGDCALFQAGNAPPFIGIIRWLRTSEIDNTELCVNWLYRPVDVKLAKGILPNAAPNEVFYSFHKDVIYVASLLHPCKVAFLRKGVELPAGISSFICRRVYDIENKCLWWLTDRDYIDERQEEVDQLLDRMQLEMHAALQSGGQSSKQLNSPSSTSQLKSGSDIVQNNGSSFTSKGKGKKWDRSDSGTEPTKHDHDCSVKEEDGDSVSFKFDNIKPEIAKMTETGSLVSTEAVEKLVDLMLLGRAEGKFDLASRVMLADIIAATDKQDCLGMFVMLKGVAVLDDWLQEAHKGKTSDGSSPKESDKGTEELLLSLLRALNKLPVNLNVLQTCNIGKSVNHLRGHKNMEIQKKARCLVDTWKKRVNAEMKNNEVKSLVSGQHIAWPGKPGFPEASHAGSRRAGSAEVSVKSTTTQSPAAKALPGKPGYADAVTKSASIASGTLKMQSSLGAPVGSSTKELLGRQTSGKVNVEMFVAAIKHEKSSSSTQSQNNSQSGSVDPRKTVCSVGKENARSSTVGLLTVSKTFDSSPRHRRSSNGLPGATTAAAHKETTFSKFVSANRTVDIKTVQSGLTCERQLDAPTADNSNSNRFIVRLPNLGRSPARSASSSSFEDLSTTGSRASSPSLADKNEQTDCKLKLRSDAFQSYIPADANAESWQSNYVKGLVASDEGDGSPGVLDDEQSRTADESGKVADPTKNASLSSGRERGDVPTEPSVMNSLNSINALAERFVKYSECSFSLPDGVVNGMDLLASVAAGERSKSESSLSGLPGIEEPCSGNNEFKSRLSCDDSVAHNIAKSDEISDLDSRKHEYNDENLGREDMQQAGPNISSDNKNNLPLQENTIAESAERSPISHLNPDRGADSCITLVGNNEEYVGSGFRLSGSGNMKGRLEGNSVYHHQDMKYCSGQVTDSNVVCKPIERNPSTNSDSCVDVVPKTVGDGSPDVVCNALGIGLDNSNPNETSVEQMVQDSHSCTIEKVVNACTTMDQQQHESSAHAISVDRLGDYAVGLSHNLNKSKTKFGAAGPNNLEFEDRELKDGMNFASLNIAEGVRSAGASLVTSSGVEGNGGKKDCSMGSTNQELPCNVLVQKNEHSVKFTGTKISSNDACGKEEPVVSIETASEALVAEDVPAKLDFDLNEGISGGDGHQCELDASAARMCSSSAIHFPSLSPLMSHLSSGYSAPITIAAPAKGPFEPLEKLLKIKGEPGWKGSAATSAFRPAEPRKILEMHTSDVPASDAARELGRLPLDIDLNVPDERVLEEIASQKLAQMTVSKFGISDQYVSVRAAEGLDFDLNRVHESAENGQFSVSSNCRLELSILPVISPSAGFAKAEGGSLRDFDMNGVGADEVNAEVPARSQVVKSATSLPVFPPAAVISTKNPAVGNASSWFTPGNSYPAVSIPPFLPDGGEECYPIVTASSDQRVFGSVADVSAFESDIYRGPVLSLSPAMAFSPATAFPYRGFPCNSSFPLASAPFSGGSTSYVDTASVGAPGFTAIPSQLVGSTSAVSSHYPRPYFISLPEGGDSIGPENSHTWATQGLDLNGCLGGTEIKGKDEKLHPASRQILVATSHPYAGAQARAYQTERARIYQTSVGGIKRKEPEGGWEAERFYKQLSWQ